MSKGNVCCVFEMSTSSQMKGYPFVLSDCLSKEEDNDIILALPAHLHIL